MNEPAASEPGPVEATPGGRPLNLSILLVILFALNALGAARGFAMRDEVLKTVPHFTPLIFNVWAAAQVLGVAGAVGLWLMRRWGLYLLAASWALAAFVDVRLAATGHAILITGLFWLVVLFVRPVRAALR